MIRAAPAMAAVAIIVGLCRIAQAQSPLTSNRPGIGDSEALVDRGTIQIESGIQFQQAPPDNERTWTQTWGQLMIRGGLGRRIEIFAGWDGLSLDRISSDGVSRIEAGGNDLRVGAKLALLNEDAHGLTLTIAPAWSFPIGAEEFSSGTNDGSLRVMWARSLPRAWSVSGNLASTYTSDDTSRYFDNTITGGVTRGLTPAVAVFAEVATAVLGAQPDTWTIDAGLAWVSRPNVQWDFSLGRGFHDIDDRWFVSAGISVRRP
jgi:Putative MetA-pathway of phenol degradation